MLTDRLYQTLIELVGIPSTSGHEEHIRSYLEQRLAALGLTLQVDTMGNLVGTLAGQGKPLLLNAHMDRVPPGLGHQPILRNGILYSDGTTNLGADDAAGIAIILEVLTHIVQQNLPHPPIVAVFDNAFAAGVVVSQGAAYEAFDIHIVGRTGHPGKDLSQTINAIEIFHTAQYPHGSLANDQTRILIGRISAGIARNAVPAILTIEGELRSFEPLAVRQRYKEDIQKAFEKAAALYGGHVEVTFNTHSVGYTISNDEPLLQTYRTVLAQRGVELQLQPTFIGSDTSGFRPKVKVFTLSTGVVNEHSVDEYVPLAPLEQVVDDTLQVLKTFRG